MPRTREQQLGAWGEDRAAAFLMRKGFLILDRNALSRYGEIDIVAFDPHTYLIYMIEVKTRRADTFITHATDAKKRRRMHRAAVAYIKARSLPYARLVYAHISVFVNEKKKTVRCAMYVLEDIG